MDDLGVLNTHRRLTDPDTNGADAAAAAVVVADYHPDHLVADRNPPDILAKAERKSLRWDTI